MTTKAWAFVNFEGLDTEGKPFRIHGNVGVTYYEDWGDVEYDIPDDTFSGPDYDLAVEALHGAEEEAFEEAFRKGLLVDKRHVYDRDPDFAFGWYETSAEEEEAAYITAEVYDEDTCFVVGALYDTGTYCDGDYEVYSKQEMNLKQAKSHAAAMAIMIVDIWAQDGTIMLPDGDLHKWME